MILGLAIRNIALIPELSLEFDGGLSVLTGETGAGKSILLGALSLLLGERASADIIRAGCESASVEGLFAADHIPRLSELLEEAGLPACEEGVLVVKRELSRNGRGRCLINGGFTTVSGLQKIGEELIDLHGQHEHQSLLHRDRQRDLLDAWAGVEPLRRTVGESFAALRHSREARERLALDEAERTRRLDLLGFQVTEIDEAHLAPGELEALAEERSRLAHAEKLIATVQNALEILHRREGAAVRDGLAESAEMLAALAPYDASLAGWADDLKNAETLVSDVIGRLSDFADSFEADPGRLEAVEERLDFLNKLKRKYGETVSEILGFRDKAAAERDRLDRQDEELERMAAEESRLAAALGEQARRLSLARREAGTRLGQALEKELKTLGFAQSVFQVAVNLREDPQGWIGWDGKHFACGPAGADEVEFLIAPNPGEDPKPVAKTASGGELSRIMLALKAVAATAAGVPTMIFDEIDAGIGGATADSVGRKLLSLAAKRQVIVITHLPQIARFAGRHFQVAKSVDHGRTSTSVRRLEGEERVQELARLLAGVPITETALQHARELIEKQ
jgi:DNA repair protein RecN (Recombination protein N)